MSDRSYLVVTVHAAPDGWRMRGRIAEVMAEHGLEDLFDDGRFIDEEADLGTAQTIARALLTLSEQITYEIRQDGYYDQAGVLAVHAPDLGLATYALTAGGDVAPNADEVLFALDVSPDLNSARQAVASLYARPYLDRFATLAAR